MLIEKNQYAINLANVRNFRVAINEGGYSYCIAYCDINNKEFYHSFDTSFEADKAYEYILQCYHNGERVCNLDNIE